MRTISLLPSLLTLCNFACGFISAVLCIQSIYWQGHGNTDKSGEYLTYAGMIIFLGMIFDMMDGRVARMTNSQCQFGGELDSMADVCTFGMAPAIILATFWIRVMPDNAQWWSFALVAGVIYAACAALRLAMYNLTISEKAKDYFSGLPSPAAAGAVVSAALLFSQDNFISMWQSVFDSTLAHTFLVEKGYKITGIYIFSVYVMIVGLLMVSPFRFVHLANLWFGKGKKFTTLVFAIMIIMLMILVTKYVLFIGFNAFIVICLFINIRNRIRNKEADIQKDMEDMLSMDSEESDSVEAVEENIKEAQGATE